MNADVRRDAVTPAPVASDALATIQDELSSSRSNPVAVMQIALMATHLDMCVCVWVGWLVGM